MRPRHLNAPGDLTIGAPGAVWNVPGDLKFGALGLGPGDGCLNPAVPEGATVPRPLNPRVVPLGSIVVLADGLLALERQLVRFRSQRLTQLP